MPTKKLTTPVCLVATGSSVHDIRHRTGFLALDPVLYVQARGEHHLVLPSLEIGRAGLEAPATRLWNATDLTGGKARGLGDQAVAILRKLRIRRVRAPGFFPMEVARALDQAGIRVDLAREAITPERVVKTSAEAARIADSQRAAARACRHAMDRIQATRIGRGGRLLDPGSGRPLTSEGLRREVEIRLLQEGYALPDGCIVAGGAQAADPHHRGQGPLNAGETIVIDIFPRHQGHGYWGDITRTVVRGEPTPTQAAMVRAVRGAQKLALGRIRAGISAATIHRAVADHLAEAGFPPGEHEGKPTGFFHGTGHGLGLEIHEAPRLGARPVRLRAGMVVTVEPGLYHPEHGGVRIEDTVLVTRTGCRVLARCPYAWAFRDPQ